MSVRNGRALGLHALRRVGAVWLAVVAIGCSSAGENDTGGGVILPPDADVVDDVDRETASDGFTADLSELTPGVDTSGSDGAVGDPFEDTPEAAHDLSESDGAVEVSPDVATDPGAGDTGGDAAPPADEAAFQAALALYDGGLFQAAIAAFEAFLDEYPGSERVDNAAYMIARCYYELGDFATARQKLEAFLAAYPGSVLADHATYYLGRAEYELADYAAAIEDLGAVIAGYPGSVYVDNAHYYRGRCRFALADYPSALADFEAVVALVASSFRDAAELWAGRAEYELGRLDNVPGSAHLPAAEGWFEQLFADYPDSPYMAQGSYYYGLAAFYRDDFPAAADRFRALRDGYPTSIYHDNAWFYLGYSLYQAASYTEALSELEGFLAAYTDGAYVDNATYFAGRSHYQLALGSVSPTAHLNAAVTYFQTVIDQYAGSIYADNAYYYQIKSYVKLGNCAKALSQLAKFKAALPGSTYVPMAESYVASHNC
jgi:TolA-binding protein